MSRFVTCTQGGVTARQPGVSVSVSLPGDGGAPCTLHVTRHYYWLRNQWGGRGRFRRLDCDGMAFGSSEEAWAFALWRGYTRRYFTAPDLRARRVAQGRRP